jgi:hypothetical protein
MRNIRHLLIALLVALVLSVAVYPAFADDVYQSEHLALAPEAGFPLRSGFVQNIHVNGPIVFAHENYVLNGALPDTTFVVWFFVHPTCDYGPVAWFPTTSFSTNVAGNGKGQAIMAPEDVPPDAHGTVIGGHWELWTDGAGGRLAYSTPCTTIVLD